MATLSSRTKAQAYRFVKQYSDVYSVKKLCRHLSVSRSGYYDWLSRGQSGHARADSELGAEIAFIYRKSEGRYGSPKIHAALKAKGLAVSRKRVARLMREAGLKARVDRVYRRQKKSRTFFKGLVNRRLEQEKASKINQQWTADVTYIKVGNRWGYLAVVIDVYSKKVLSWALSDRLDSNLTMFTIVKALASRKPKRGLLFHTDRGREYCADRVRHLLAEHGVEQSMNRPGKCTDNAEVESFFKSLKGELIKDAPIANLRHLREKLRKYIQYFYNRTRLHSSIGYMSPIAFEK
ncbi:IS3 family transposase [Salinivibrio kushneri]|uniref:IS3 family transposase n=2 Tax=Vibrionaceae TaxID=641 RepID=UPI00098885AF|nr:IS3 family transposase [Salinivibrio kushneri]